MHLNYSLINFSIYALFTQPFLYNRCSYEFYEGLPILLFFHALIQTCKHYREKLRNILDMSCLPKLKFFHYQNLCRCLRKNVPNTLITKFDVFFHCRDNLPSTIVLVYKIGIMRNKGFAAIDLNNTFSYWTKYFVALFSSDLYSELFSLLRELFHPSVIAKINYTKYSLIQRI